MKNWIWVIALLMVASCTPDRNLQEENGKSAACAVCFDNWDRLEDKLAYFKELLDLQDSAIAGQEISIQHLQALMPQNRVDFQVFMATERYAIIKEGDDDVESPRALYLIAGEMAAADTLDMMAQYLKWFDWSDGWVTETLWSTAIDIEKRHPEKFQRLMQSSEWYDDWQEWSDELLEYEKESEK
ncbi:MAG: hypothetical protein K6E93_10265 [Bacteroidales bacterium]|nr:hypothetical protein [Bacteroidales bacterium]